ncbi:efflux RND transporter periplasmic adaptor subunit [Daejeonella sp.]|uniref:efflux RND transporter periplasmic adaptor subunit n=1 Tax=Daejeonella sp. TaxID=2805397 RepID=UPI003982D9E9
MTVSTRFPAFFVLLLILACNNGKKEDHTLHNEAGKKELVRSELSLESSLKSGNELVISTIPVIAIKKDRITVEIDAMGRVEYDTRMIGSISARVSGRIEKLYVRYKYQHIQKGQKIMDVYSPELLTAQQNLLFVTRNDPSNSSLIGAATQKLLLLGMSAEQIKKVLQTGNSLLAVRIYSRYTGHLHNTSEVSNPMKQQKPPTSMESTEPGTELLTLKEGMYIQKGQTLFSIYNPSKAWALLNIYTDRQALLKKGQLVNIYPESSASTSFQGRVDFIEPFYRDKSRTTSIRVYFDNSNLRLPIGSQVRGRIRANTDMAYWLPKESVTSLGINKIVFLKVPNGFKPKKVTTGVTAGKSIQIIKGLSESDSLALNAQFLIDSESFIKVKE